MFEGSLFALEEFDGLMTPSELISNGRHFGSICLIFYYHVWVAWWVIKLVPLLIRLKRLKPMKKVLVRASICK